MCMRQCDRWIKNDIKFIRSYCTKTCDGNDWCRKEAGNEPFSRSLSCMHISSTGVWRQDSHLVVVLFHEAAQRQTEALVRPDAPIHGVHRPWRLVLVDLLSLPVERHAGSSRETQPLKPRTDYRSKAPLLPSPLQTVPGLNKRLKAAKQSQSASHPGRPANGDGEGQQGKVENPQKM